MLTFPAPTAEQLEAWAAGGRAKSTAVKAWRKAAAVQVDGLTIRPGLREMRTAFTFGAPVAVTQQHVDAERARQEKRRRFRAHCERLGLENGVEFTSSHHRCDHCSKAREGYKIHQPDASGYPTWVLFECVACHRSR